MRSNCCTEQNKCVCNLRSALCARVELWVVIPTPDSTNSRYKRESTGHKMLQLRQDCLTFALAACRVSAMLAHCWQHSPVISQCMSIRHQPFNCTVFACASTLRGAARPRPLATSNSIKLYGELGCEWEALGSSNLRLMSYILTTPSRCDFRCPNEVGGTVYTRDLDLQLHGAEEIFLRRMNLSAWHMLLSFALVLDQVRSAMWCGDTAACSDLS